MKKWILFFLIFSASPLIFSAENRIQKSFDEANTAYEKGDIETALHTYLSLVDQGFESNALYYNLGNISYKKGERGKAVLWYERALRINPRDSDTKFNLNLARAHIKEERQNILESILFLFTTGELGWTMVFFLWLFFIALGLKLLGWMKTELPSTFILWTAGIGLIFIGGWFITNAYFASQPEAIVIAPPGEVRNGPGQDYAVGFTIPEGSKVLVLNRRPEWTQVGVPEQGLKGWLQNKDIELITSSGPSLS